MKVLPTANSLPSQHFVKLTHSGQILSLLKTEVKLASGNSDVSSVSADNGTKVSMKVLPTANSLPSQHSVKLTHSGRILSLLTTEVKLASGNGDVSSAPADNGTKVSAVSSQI